MAECSVFIAATFVSVSDRKQRSVGHTDAETMKILRKIRVNLLNRQRKTKTKYWSITFFSNVFVRILDLCFYYYIENHISLFFLNTIADSSIWLRKLAFIVRGYICKTSFICLFFFYFKRVLSHFCNGVFVNYSYF